MIEVDHLTKRYGAVTAVSDVTFEVGRGEVVGFLGPNGAGKTTTLRILCGYLGASSGRVRIAGHDIGDEPLRARQSLGYMPESAPLYPELRVREYLRFRAELKGVTPKQRSRRVETALDQANIRDVSERLIGNLSKGYRQRVGLADALVADPPLLILDEPTAGLDPNQIREVRDLIRQLGQDHTLLLSTHILPEVETVCDRALVIDHGKLVAEGSLAELRTSNRESKLRVGLLVPINEETAWAGWLSGELQRAFNSLPDEAQTHIEVCETRRDEAGQRLDLEVSVRLTRAGKGPNQSTNAIAHAQLAATVNRVVRARGLDLVELSHQSSSLEEVFAGLTRDPSGGARPDATDREGS